MGLLVGMVLDNDFAAEVKHDAFDKKLLMSVVKPNVIRMVPPLIVSKAEIDEACDIIESILANY